MKKILGLSVLLLFCATAVLAMGETPRPRVQTGDKDLDKALVEVEKRAGTPDGAKAVRLEIAERYRIKEGDIDFLRKRGYTLGEVYYCGLLARYSGRGIREIAALRGQGVGWGQMAMRVGAKPADLNKLRVRIRKETGVKMQKMEKERIRVTPVPAPRVKPAPAGKRR